MERDIQNVINEYIGLQHMTGDDEYKLSYIKKVRPISELIEEVDNYKFIKDISILDYLRHSQANKVLDKVFLQCCVTDDIETAKKICASEPIYIDIRGYILAKNNNAFRMLLQFYKNKWQLYGSWTVPICFKLVQ